MFELRPDGYLNLLAVPTGLLAFLVFVPLFWLLPAKRIRGGLIVTSVAFAALTWPASWNLTLAAAILYGWVIIAICQSRVAADPTARGSNRKLEAFVWIAVHLPYAPAVVWPNLPWLPREPVVANMPYYWIAWFGLGYVVIRVVHVALDVCRGKIAHVGFVDYLAFILFPLVIRMGPIMRYQDFADQITNWRDRISLRAVGSGLLRIFLGLIRFGLVAHVFVKLVVPTYEDAPQELSRLVVLRSVIFTPLLIYTWIAGYVDVSVGLGRMMGFVIPENFHWPWQAGSVREFWKRWHITLGSWLFEYIYVPLGGSRRRVLLNYTATFGYCAVWHGVFGSYFVWGLSQAVGLYVNRRWYLLWTDQRERRTPLYEALRRWHVVGGWLSWGAGWLLTVSYQITTLCIFVDDAHMGGRWLGYLLGLYHG